MLVYSEVNTCRPKIQTSLVLLLLHSFRGRSNVTDTLVSPVGALFEINPGILCRGID